MASTEENDASNVFDEVVTEESPPSCWMINEYPIKIDSENDNLTDTSFHSPPQNKRFKGTRNVDTTPAAPETLLSNKKHRLNSPPSCWRERFEQLTPQYLSVKETKETTTLDGIVAMHGENKEHVLVCKSTTDPSLKRWINLQRKHCGQRKRSQRLSKTEIALLNLINFIWKPNECMWEIRLNELMQFREEHGHCLVSRNYKHFPKLGAWVIGLRHRRKNQEKETPTAGNAPVTKKQIAALDELHFEWNADDR